MPWRVYYINGRCDHVNLIRIQEGRTGVTGHVGVLLRRALIAEYYMASIEAPHRGTGHKSRFTVIVVRVE